MVYVVQCFIVPLLATFMNSSQLQLVAKAQQFQACRALDLSRVLRRFEQGVHAKRSFAFGALGRAVRSIIALHCFGAGATL